MSTATPTKADPTTQKWICEPCGMIYDPVEGDLADWLSLEYVGLGGAWDHQELEAYDDERRFALRYTRRGRLVGVCSIGGAADLDRARAELATGAAAERVAA